MNYEKLDNEKIPQEKDIPYVPIHNFEKSDTIEKEIKHKIVGTRHDENFPGFIIVDVEKSKGIIVGYAIKEDDEEKLTGSKIEYNTNGSILSIKDLNEDDFDELILHGVIKAFKDQKHKEENQQTHDAKAMIIKACIFGGGVNPFSIHSTAGQMINAASNAFSQLSSTGQNQVTAHFFNEIISPKESDRQNGLSAYYIFKDTPFGEQLQRKLLEAGHNIATL